MQIRPLDNKAWASIFLVMVFLAAMYFFNFSMLSAQLDSPSFPDTLQSQ